MQEKRGRESKLKAEMKNDQFVEHGNCTVGIRTRFSRDVKGGRVTIRLDFRG